MDPGPAKRLKFNIDRNGARDDGRLNAGYAEKLDQRTHGYDPKFDGSQKSRQKSQQNSNVHVPIYVGALPWQAHETPPGRKRHQQRPVSPSSASAGSDVSMSDASPPPPKHGPRPARAPATARPTTPESPSPHMFETQGPLLSESDYSRYDVAAQLVEDIRAGYEHIIEELGNSGGGKDVAKLSKRIATQISLFRTVVDSGDLVESIRETLVRANESHRRDRWHGRGEGGTARSDLIETIENRLQRILRTINECKKKSSWLREKVFQVAVDNARHTPKPTRQTAAISASKNPKNPFKVTKPSGAKNRHLLQQMRRPAQLRTVKVSEAFKALVKSAYGLMVKLAEESLDLTLPIASQASRSLGADRGDSSAEQRVEIPAELLSTREATGQIVDLLCRGCPSEDHQAHQLLLGLATETAAENKDEVQFYLALECRGNPGEARRLWFRVASKVEVHAAKGTAEQQPQFPEPMEIDGASQLLRTPGSSFSPAAESTPGTSPFPSPSMKLPPPVPQPPQPAVRFCLTNHAQYWTNTLAVSLSNPAHKLFYPRSLDKSSARFHSPPTPLAALLACHKDGGTVCPPPEEKIRWMRLLAEAVLKFNVVFDNKIAEHQPPGNGSSLRLDEKSVFFYNTTGGKRELHWRVDLVKSPPPSPSEQEKQHTPVKPHAEGGTPPVPQPPSLSIKSILRNLGDVFLRILRNPEWPAGEAVAVQLSRVKKEFNGPLHNVVRNCLDGTIGQQSDDFGKEEVQRKFYEQVVSRLRKREEPLSGLGARRRGLSESHRG